jgi:uncharacterized protein
MSDAGWRTLPPAARTVWTLGGAIPIAVAGLVLAGLTALASPPAAVAVLVLTALGCAGWTYVARRRWAAWGYTERDRDLVIRRGVLIRRMTIVPYGRMQFVDVRQGPVARYMRLASVKLHTAAAASDAEIPLLAQEEAARLRDRLTALGEAHAAGL